MDHEAPMPANAPESAPPLSPSSLERVARLRCEGGRLGPVEMENKPSVF
jgi:hypothetical protein